jgi:deazaflavin-dependent oxidoreductase (nitroreductase family)
MPKATETLKEQLASQSEIEISVVGRKTGRRITNPVWFVVEGDNLYLLPVQGSDTQWYKNVLQNRRIRISAGGVAGELEPTPITDPKIVASVVEKFRTKHGASEVKKYYSNFDVAVVVKIA